MAEKHVTSRIVTDPGSLFMPEVIVYFSGKIIFLFKNMYLSNNIWKNEFYSIIIHKLQNVAKIEYEKRNKFCYKMNKTSKS